MAEFTFESDCLSQEERRALAAALAPVADADASLSVELVCVSGEEIQELNAKFRGVDRVTDVLSFPAMDGIYKRAVKAREHADCFDGESLFLGSVVICEERAREQAEEYGHSFGREFFYLTVHGVLHCLGYDHMTEEDKREMRLKEEEVMDRMNLKRQ